MDYREYFDRVYGCWLGKCICGSIGAPLEGCKQLFNYRFDPAFWRIALPNDDLELQILWLNVIERIGLGFDADDLADAFLAHVPYNPGEYAYFKRNYRRGIHPPASGTYNNHYYHEGMGCCIRAEIWACLAAGDPALAARICREDGQIDHSAESVYSESFVAAAEAAAFVESDLDRLIAAGLAQIPPGSKLAKLVRDVLRWCGEESDWRRVREQVLRHYGHPDCTNMFQNIGITLLALKMGGGDLEKTTLIALNSGYDTDCTCGIAGAVLGIVSGAEALQRKYGVSDTGFVTNFKLHRPSDRIERLARDVARLTGEAERFWNRSLRVTGLPPEVAGFRLPERKRAFRFRTEYDGLPVIEAGCSARCRLLIDNLSGRDFHGRLHLSSDTLIPEYSDAVAIPAGGSVAVAVTVRHTDSAEISDANLVHAELAGTAYDFGFAAAVPFRVYGPLADNFDNVPQVDLFGPHYDKFLPQGDFPNRSTAVRNYHLNSRAGLDLSLPDEAELVAGTSGREPDGRIAAADDLIPVDSAFGCAGPATFYLVSEFTTPVDMDMPISIGHSGPLVFWLDGRELVRSRLETWRTPENLNLDMVKLPAGKHRAVFKVVRQGERVTLSINYKGSFRPGERADAHCTNFIWLA
ncbi:MAG: ADP-ribosylglycohydrolase family protein [Lentisphaeria bacterium]|nr:ADP-ribosylglycohydrolase family protein [Lentisphaeria bacterium]